MYCLYCTSRANLDVRIANMPGKQPTAAQKQPKMEQRDYTYHLHSIYRLYLSLNIIYSCDQPPSPSNRKNNISCDQAALPIEKAPYLLRSGLSDR